MKMFIGKHFNRYNLIDLVLLQPIMYMSVLLYITSYITRHAEWQQMYNLYSKCILYDSSQDFFGSGESIS